MPAMQRIAGTTKPMPTATQCDEDGLPYPAAQFAPPDTVGRARGLLLVFSAGVRGVEGGGSRGYQATVSWSRRPHLARCPLISSWARWRSGPVPASTRTISASGVARSVMVPPGKLIFP